MDLFDQNARVMFILFVLVGLLVFVVLRVQMLSSELSWIRRYLVRVVTQQRIAENEAPEEEDDVEQAATESSPEQKEASTLPSEPRHPRSFDLGDSMMNAILKTQVLGGMSAHMDEAEFGYHQESLGSMRRVESGIVELDLEPRVTPDDASDRIQDEVEYEEESAEEEVEEDSDVSEEEVPSPGRR